MIPRYGHVSYELPRALGLVDDIEAYGGLSSAGEQHPNTLSCHDSAACLHHAILSGQAAEEGYSDECIKAMGALEALLDRVGTQCHVLVGSEDAPGRGGLQDMRRLCDRIVETMPQEWNLPRGP